MAIHSQNSESFVLVREKSYPFRHPGIVRCVSVRSETLPSDEGNLEYEEGKDYLVDYRQGTIRRTPGSRIPDWSHHVFYGQTGFDHTKYETFSNRPFTVWIDYEYEASEVERADLPAASSTRPLEMAMRRLADKLPVRYVVFGDSISAGGEASREAFAFYRLLEERMAQLFPDAEIEVVNASIPGEISPQGLERLERDVIALKPDLVTIGYGMNDQCRDESVRNAVPPEQFERTVAEMVTKIRQRTDAEIVLITPCVSNPLWVHSSGDLQAYADVLRRIGMRQGVCVADVHSLWLLELQAGKTHESLLLNNINHPNDYGHRVYYEAFLPLIGHI